MVTSILNGQEIIWTGKHWRVLGPIVESGKIEGRTSLQSFVRRLLK